MCWSWTYGHNVVGGTEITRADRNRVEFFFALEVLQYGNSSRKSSKTKDSVCRPLLSFILGPNIRIGSKMLERLHPFTQLVG